MKKRRDSAIERFTVIIETVFLALAGIYYLWDIEYITLFSLPLPAWLDSCLLLSMSVAAALHLALVAPRRKSALLSLPLAGFYYLCYRMNGLFAFRYLAIFTVGYAGIDYRKILKTYLLTVGVFFVITIVAGVTGTIPDYIYTRVGEGLRSAWGTCYPTDFASVALFLAMYIWVAWRKLPDWGALIVCGLSILLSRYIAHSSTSFSCSVAFLAAILYYAAERNVISRRPGLRWMRRGSELLLQWAFPLCTLVMFGLMALYSRGTDAGYRLNNLMSNRMKLAVDAWRNYGLKPFGTLFTQIGNGFSIITPENYNFVDSSYPLILIRYGWVPFLGIGAIWCWLTRKAIRNGNKRMALVMGIIALHSFSEHHFLETLYNVLLVMPFASIGAPEAKRSASKKLKGSRSAKGAREKLAAGALTAMLGGIAAWIAGPKLLSWLKTVYELKGLTGGGAQSWIVIGSLLALLGLAAAAARALYCVLVALMRRRAVTAKPVAALIACAAVALGGFLYGSAVIEAGTRDADKMLEADREALEIATEAATGGVYSGILPAVYKRAYPGMSYAALSGDELARYRGITVLADSATEHRPYLMSNCLYAEISKEHALYTSDEAVIEALRNAGYHLTGYYDSEIEADLAGEAEFRGVKYGRRRGMKVTSEDQLLSEGPYQTLFSGSYTASWHLFLPKKERGTGGEVCVVQVVRNYGEEVVIEKAITREQFGEDNRLTVSLPFTMGDSRGVAFRVFASEGRSMNVRWVSYRRTPQYDIHAKYDGQLRKIWEETYTLEGEPVISTGNYFATEYGYDRYDNVSLMRYYDIDGERTMINSGYAEVRREYDSRKQVVRERYGDLDGKPTRIKAGYAEFRAEYDEAGNQIRVRYFDKDGKPAVIPAGYAEIRKEYNADKLVTREEYYDASGTRTAQISGYSAALREYDERKKPSRISYLDGEDRPVCATNGVAEVRYEYDGMGRNRREAYYDAAGNPVENASGVAVLEREYDDAGNATAERYFDAAGNPAVSTAGYAELRREYNAQRQAVSESYYGANGAPIACTGRYYGTKKEYDGVGNVIRQSFVDADGNPAVCSGGYAAIERSYDENRNVTREIYYGPEGERAYSSAGVAEVRRTFNEENQNVEESYYDAEGRLMENGSGNATVRREYNALNQVVREAYYGADGEPAAAQGYCAAVYSYNEAHMVEGVEYRDADGNAVASAAGYAQERYSYDEARNKTGVAYLDAEGQPVKNTSGIAAIRFEYAAKRNVLEQYCDEAGNPVACTGGYSAVRREYDGDKRVSVMRYLDAEGQPVCGLSGVAAIRYRYDGLGRVEREEYLDARDRATANTAGTAATEKGYDQAGNAVWERYYDLKGSVAANLYGYAELRREFNEKRWTVRERYYSPDGSPVTGTGGSYGVEREFDAIGNAVRQTNIGLDGAPMTGANGVATTLREFDGRRNAIGERYLDREGQSIESASGIALIRREYDAQNRVVYEEYLNAAGETVEARGYRATRYLFNEDYSSGGVEYADERGEAFETVTGIAGQRYRYDEDRQKVEMAYVGADGRLAADEKGIAVIRYDYEDRRQVRELYFDIDGEILVCDGGYSGLARRYDADGNVVEIAYIDRYGRPVVNAAAGYAASLREYDAARNCVAEYFCDAQGNRVANNDGVTEILRAFDEDRRKISEETR